MADTTGSNTLKRPGTFVIAIHGGVSDSGRLDKDFEVVAKAALQDVIDLALKRLVNGESAPQVAEAAVAALEDAAMFNAGKGLRSMLCMNMRSIILCSILLILAFMCVISSRQLL